MTNTPVSQMLLGLIQRNLRIDEHAIIRLDDELWHYFRDSSNFEWHRAGRVREEETFTGATIQSHLKGFPEGTFQVVVPLKKGAGCVELWRFSNDSRFPGRHWQVVEQIIEVDDRVTGVILISMPVKPEEFSLSVALHGVRTRTAIGRRLEIHGRTPF
ncbi:hypothetical protein ACFVW1_40750 [Streptomyces olivochromogenes]|uniref:hypothetical protein n=1 Tax=Streptomyces olivochromogenes TaxID=1963 RepID=UPI0036DB5B94